MTVSGSVDDRSFARSSRRMLAITSRVVAGTFGVYALSVQITIAASLLLSACGMDRVTAVTAATLASFAVFTALAIWAFHTHSTVRVWLWLAGVGLPLALLNALLSPL